MAYRDNSNADAGGAATAQQSFGTLEAANLLRSLGNPHRLMIVKLLNEAPLNVMELCAQLNLRQSLASQHLARLRLDGIVSAERQGHHVFYSVNSQIARDILYILMSAISSEDSAPAMPTTVNQYSKSGGGVAGLPRLP